MPETYVKVDDLPETLRVFPLRGVILLPRSTLPLNVFEPRYLALVNDVLAGDRLIGIVQPDTDDAEESPLGKQANLRKTGGAGRLTAFQETDDGRYLITLSGICRFVIDAEENTDAPYRMCSVDWKPFAGDLEHGRGEEAVDRDRLLAVLKRYLEANKLSADWDGINNSSNELLVNTLSMISPYGPEEKQALLEAGDLKTRAEVLVALAEMELASGEGSTGSTLQ
ncbi:MAG: LON peptidase substrate-binding domain-containing protein [Hyphomicrobiaceae bacterium]|nr:LON peptidase substrate-binding domain-containing protein [Hyphomicrobiaceae bacterium]